MTLPLLLAALAAAESVATPPRTPSIPFTKYELPNGLDVTLAPDHSVPFACVNVWYNVGSKDETPGRSGFAHLFEHLMFNGSKHHDDEFFKPLQPLGARLNGSTNLDRTNYYECLPAEQLPLAMFLEADRMGWLLPALTGEKLANQKEVVRNERRQNYDNRPYGTAWLSLLKNTFPAGHPYHIATIGLHEEIDAATLDDVKAFFTKWYLPNNASLVITGDFEDATARALVDQYFAPVPRGPDPERTPPAPARFEREVQVRVAEEVPFEQVWMVWHTPALFAPGDAELDLLSSALGDGKESPLYQSLVIEKKLAQDVSIRQNSLAYQSFLVINATASTGHTAAEIVAAVDEVLAAARERGVSANDLAVGLTNYEVGFFANITTIQGKADLLNNYNTRTADPGYLGKDLARYRAATPEAVNAAFREWIVPDRRLVLVYGPEAQ